ncbi:hypothetical protein GCM10011489_14780 [Gordonia jinhuaensis]|uniref:Uncharacterized protein n=1 Tax=Gordonia jinhuaensis TaxID=1517702 RepID=A0A916WT92_9ACTN|nr:hypothetical protein GCM10011489_14780 [Gordonia jinhuaensis]
MVSAIVTESATGVNNPSATPSSMASTNGRAHSAWIAAIRSRCRSLRAADEPNSTHNRLR